MCVSVLCCEPRLRIRRRRDDRCLSHTLTLLSSLSVQRYFGVASGKGTRSAKTEIEKLKLGEKTCREALGCIAKMCVRGAMLVRTLTLKLIAATAADATLNRCVQLAHRAR
jgi:hypothetical protein